MGMMIAMMMMMLRVIMTIMTTDYDYAVRPFLLVCLSGASAVNTCISQTTVKVSSCREFDIISIS